MIPPGYNAHLEDRRLCLTLAERQNIPKPSANELFTSLAEAFSDHALALVLSGTGSDGSHGVRHLKAKGGFVLAKDLRQARYSGMPKAAIDTGGVDRVRELERELVTTREHLHTSVEDLATSNEELQSTNEALLTVNEELQGKTRELSQALGDLENIKNALPAVNGHQK